MKVAVIGSRTFTNRELLFDTLNTIGEMRVIVSGGAPGADRMAEQYAKAKGIQTEIHKADWDNLTHPEAVIRFKFGKKYDANAGFRRNKTIVDNVDLVVAFWDGASPGTKNALDYARKQNKEIRLVNFMAKAIKSTMEVGI